MSKNHPIQNIRKSLQQALHLCQAGKLLEAKNLYLYLLKIVPSNFEALTNLGTIELQLGNFQIGEQLLQKSISIEPNQPQALMNLGNRFLESGSYNDSIAFYDKAILLNPVYATAYYNRGKAFSELMKFEHAIRDYDKSILINPNYLMAYINRGITLSKLKKYDEAIKNYKLVLKLAPNFAEAHYNCGVSFHDLERYDDALASYDRAIELKPDYVEAYSNRGITYHDLKRYDDALASYDRAIELKPDYAEAYYNRGVTCHDLKRYDDALASYDRAIELKPDYVEAYSNRGVTCHDLKRYDDALASYDRAIELKPDYAVAHLNLGTALVPVGKHNDAVASFYRALQIKPDYVEAHSNLIFTLDMMPETDTCTLQQERKRWAELHAAHLRQHLPYANPLDPERRLRIGYVSADFNHHSAATVFGAMLTHFDRTRFDVVAYSNSTKTDWMTQSFQQSVTDWRNISEQSDDAVADLIRRDEIDILVDLSGHSSGNRLLVFARKPAPIQITAWGYIGGTGMQAMDVFFADPVVVPPDEITLYTEEVRYLPNVVSAFFPNTFPPVNSLPALSGDGITFGSFNRLAKISDEAYQVWAQVLLSVPKSRMVLKTLELDNARTRDRVIEHFTSAGVAPERITLLGKSSWVEHMAVFNQIDISLDPFPHGGGVTSLEGLMMGVPIVTLCWPTLTGRVSTSILTILGLTDWIAETPAQYVEIAIQKAKDIAILAELRQQFRSRLTSSVIGDTRAYVRSVEQEYITLWREWCGKSHC